MTKILISFHNHTEHSFDSSCSVKDRIDMAVQKGVNVLCITDHDIYGLDGKDFEYAEMRGVELIAGIEFSCIGNLHIIGFHENIKILERRRFFYTVPDLLKELRTLGAIIYMPHPYHRTGALSAYRWQNVMNDVDIVEIFNWKHGSIVMNPLIYLSNKLLVVADDSHSLLDFGHALTSVSITGKISFKDILTVERMNWNRHLEIQITIRRLMKLLVHYINNKSGYRISKFLRGVHVRKN
jgi:hypothetical protein